MVMLNMALISSIEGLAQASSASDMTLNEFPRGSEGQSLGHAEVTQSQWQHLILPRNTTIF